MTVCNQAISRYSIQFDSVLANEYGALIWQLVDSDSDSFPRGQEYTIPSIKLHHIMGILALMWEYQKRCTSTKSFALNGLHSDTLRRLYEITTWISNHAHDCMWDVMTYLCANFNSGLNEPSLTLGPGRAITPHNVWMQYNSSMPNLTNL